MKKITTLLLLLLCSQFTTAQEEKDTTAVHDVLQVLSDAWQEGNGEKFASVFTDTHDFIVWTGYYFRQNDKAANAQNHNYIFEHLYKDTRMYLVLDKLDFITPQIALIHVLGAVDINGEGMPKDPAVIWTGLLVKTDGAWKIRSFHNADLEVFTNERLSKASPLPVEKMYASWYAALKK